MRILKQLMIILFISFLGEILKMVIPLPIPASVYGLVIMVAALKTGILKLHQVKDASSVLIETMPVMFIPAAVGSAPADLRTGGRYHSYHDCDRHGSHRCGNADYDKKKAKEKEIKT